MRNGLGVALEIVYLPGAEADLLSIYDWLAGRSDPSHAVGYIDRIQTTCEGLAYFASRGTPHDELEVGLRSIPFERRATIYYRVSDEAVEIVRILYAGQDSQRAFALD